MLIIIKNIHAALINTLCADRIHMKPMENILSTCKAQSYWYNLHKLLTEAEKKIIISLKCHKYKPFMQRLHWFTHTHIDTHTHTYTNTHTHSSMHARTHAHTHTHTHTLSPLNTNTHTCSSIHAHTHTPLHSHTHAHTLIHTHTQTPKQKTQVLCRLPSSLNLTRWSSNHKLPGSCPPSCLHHHAVDAPERRRGTSHWRGWGRCGRKWRSPRCRVECSCSETVGREWSRCTCHTPSMIIYLQCALKKSCMQQ